MTAPNLVSNSTSPDQMGKINLLFTENKRLGNTILIQSEKITDNLLQGEACVSVTVPSKELLGCKVKHLLSGKASFTSWGWRPPIQNIRTLWIQTLPQKSLVPIILLQLWYMHSI